MDKFKSSTYIKIVKDCYTYVAGNVSNTIINGKFINGAFIFKYNNGFKWIKSLNGEIISMNLINNEIYLFYNLNNFSYYNTINTYGQLRYSKKLKYLNRLTSSYQDKYNLYLGGEGGIYTFDECFTKVNGTVYAITKFMGKLYYSVSDSNSIRLFKECREIYKINGKGKISSLKVKDNKIIFKGEAQCSIIICKRKVNKFKGIIDEDILTLIDLSIKDNEVWTWGQGKTGSLGNGKFKDSYVPTLALAKNIIKIHNGSRHALAIDCKGNLYTWGENKLGQLGDGTNKNSSIPIKINISNIIDVNAFNHSSMVLDKYGNVWAWGDNSQGQLGIGTNNDVNIPTKVLIKNVKQANVGKTHALFLTTDNTMYATGDNTYGQFGNGTTINSNIPINTKVTNMRYISAGYDSSLGIDENSQLFGWGYNSNGEIGDGTTNNSHVPIKSKLKNIIQIDNIADNSIALDNYNRVWNWGSNTYGQLGDGTNNDSIVPIRNGLNNIKEISSGYRYNMVLDNNNYVWTYGRNYLGALGDGTTNNSNVPINIKFKAKTITSEGFSTTLV